MVEAVKVRAITRLASRVSALALLIGAGALAFGPPALAQQAPAAGVSAGRAATLSTDPKITSGRLPNGLTYAIMKTDSPDKSVSFRMRVNVGSMNEADDQHGVSHLLEHLAFHGVEGRADTDFVQRFADEGITMGTGLNAETSQTDTIYKINLAEPDARKIKLAVDFFGTVASRLPLEEAAVRTEGKIVLAEERARAGAALDISLAQIKFLFGNHPYTNLPIGDVAFIESAPVAAVRDYYRKYYTPERTTIVIAGPVDPQQIKQMLEETFSDWRAPRQAAAGAPPVRLDQKEAAFQSLKAETLTTQLAIIWQHPPVTWNDDTVAARITAQGIATRVIGTRLQQLTKSAGSPMAAAQGGVTDAPGIVRLFSLSGLLVSDWRKSLEVLTTAQRQIFETGFTEAEVQQAIDEAITAQKAGIELAPSRLNTSLADALQSAISHGRNYRSPDQVLADIVNYRPQMTAAHISKVARDLMSGSGPYVFLAAPDAPPEAELRAAYTQAMTAPLAAVEAQRDIVWSHTDFGAKGRVVDQQRLDRVGATVVRFENGVRMTVRPSTVSPSQILVQVKFGHGKLDLPVGATQDEKNASSLITMGGLADLSTDDIGKVLKSRAASVSASMEDTAFSLRGATRPADLDLQLQLLAAKVSAPGWRTDKLPLLRNVMSQLMGGLQNSPQGVFLAQGDTLLRSGDTRWSDPATADAFTNWDVDRSIKFIEPILRQSPLEVVIVGDTTVEAAIEAVAKTLGALPARTGKAPVAVAGPVFPAATDTPLKLFHTGRADQAYATVVWKTAGVAANPREAAIGSVLAGVIRKRALEALRAQAGQSYSPSARALFSQDFPDYGYLQISADISTAQSTAFFDAIDAIAQSLQTTDVSADELNEIKSAIGVERRREQDTNTYWLGALGGELNATRQDYLSTYATVVPDISAAEVRAAARKWLTKDRTWKAAVVAPPA